MSSRQSFSLGKGLSGAVAAVPAAWSGAWLSLVLLLAAVAAWPLVGLHFGTPAALGWGLVLVLLKLVALGGLYRTFIFGRAAAAEGRGPGGLQFGATEVRLLFASLVIALFVAMILAAGFFVLAIAFDFSGLASGYNSSLAAWHAAVMRHRTVTDWAFIVLPHLLALLLIFVAMKFVLAPVATVAGKRMVTLNALGLSSGNVGKLFIGVVLLALPFIVAFAAVMHLPAPTRMSHMNTCLWVWIATAVLSVGVLLPLQTGFLASAYRQIVDLRAK